jgi:hypothetical protein
MHSDRQEIAHELSHALTTLTALSRANEGREIALTYREVAMVVERAWEELTRPVAAG